MRRWLIPALLILLLLMLDTAVLPVFVSSVYSVPLTLALVICIGAGYGRISGMLYGMAAGLLIDVLVGYPLGLRLFQYIAAGFLSGLIVYVTDAERLEHGFRRGLYALRLALFSIGFHLASEAVICVYQYFNTARFEAIYALNALVRVGIGAALVLIIYVPFMRLAAGRKKSPAPARSRREVKFF